jgi:hypothetical protein
MPVIWYLATEPPELSPDRLRGYWRSVRRLFLEPVTHPKS